MKSFCEKPSIHIVCFTIKIGLFFLYKGITERQKLSKPARALEEAGLKSAGIDMEWIAPILVGLGLLLVTFILLNLKVLTWFLIVLMNVAFLAYWMQIRQHSSNDLDDVIPPSMTPETEYHNSPESAQPANASRKNRFSRKMIFA